MSVTVRTASAVVFAVKYFLLTWWSSVRGLAGLEWLMQPLGVPLSKVVCLTDVHQQSKLRRFSHVQLHWHPTARFPGACSNISAWYLKKHDGPGLSGVRVLFQHSHFCRWVIVWSLMIVSFFCSCSWSSVEAGGWAAAQWGQILSRLECYHLAQFFREKGVHLIAFGNLNT